MYPLRIVILFFMLASSILSFSQAGVLKFSHLTTNEGPYQNSVFSILKDHKGFMWFATDQGLNKYDGYKLTVYKHDPENTESISNSWIADILEDTAHNLWLVSASGLDKFDRIKESFKHYCSVETQAVYKAAFEDSKKRIWLSTSAGFCLFDTDKGKFRFYINNDTGSNSLSQNYIFKITEDNYGELWIGTRNGLTRFNPETGKFINYVNEPGNSKSIGAGYIKTVYKDSKGNIWAGTQGSGIALFNRQENSFINYKHDPLNPASISHNDILSFTEDALGNLWIGTENGGINLFNYSKKTFVCYKNNENNPHSLSSNSVHSLYKDDIGNIWAGTWTGGINLLPHFGDKFAHYRKMPDNVNSLNNNLVLAIGGDADNKIWIGTDGGGLSSFDPRSQDFKNYHNDITRKNSIYSNYVLSISDYTPGILALGFHRGGIDFFDVKKNSFTHYAPGDTKSNKFTSPSVNVVYRDRQKNLWVGLNDYGGIYLFDQKTKKFTVFHPGMKTGKNNSGTGTYSIYETKAGQLWVGGNTGLHLFDRSKKEFISYQQDPNDKTSLSNNFVFSIMEDHTGNLWLGTLGGLNFLDIKTKIFTAYTEKQGLPNNTVWSTQEDHKGNLWISTNKGLSKFNPLTRVFRNYTINDGVQGNSFKGKASYQLPDGQMFFGGTNGLNTFYPDSIKDNDYVPPVYITDFLVLNKPVGIGGSSPLQQSINETKEITLSYSQSVITIGFSALNFTHPEDNMYAYKLEGFDKEWNYSGNKRTATYTNLDPGTYVFKVKASNNDGVWNEKGTSLTIIVTPPFWLTWWFRMAIVMLVLGSGLGFYWNRMTRIQKQKLLLEQKVKEQTLQLSHTNEELANKNIEMEQFVYIASHDLREPLRTTTSFIELLQKQYNGKLDERADKYLFYISQSADRMKLLISDLLDYSKIDDKKELQQLDCSIILKEVLTDLGIALKEAGAEIKFEDLPVIMGHPTGIKQLFQNLITNGIKFRKKDVSPKIQISSELKDNAWHFIFRDNGIGIEPQHREKIFVIFQRLHTKKEYEGSGIGLAHCKKIVELHKGNIWVESAPGEGSMFHFTIPKGDMP